MGSHSVQQKRTKRRNQKKRKRHKHKQNAPRSVDEQSQESSSSPLSSRSEDVIYQVAPQEELPSFSSSQSDSTLDSGALAVLDCVEEESDEYWEVVAEAKIKEFDSYRDAHPCIVTDKERTITVHIDGAGKYKGTSALRRVELTNYFSEVKVREEKATEVCRILRDRIETLEGALKDSKIRMMKMHRENQRKIEKVRYFWRNKIFEGNSRGGELLKAALIYPDMYS